MIKIFNLQFEDNNMELRELLEIFGKSGYGFSISSALCETLEEDIER